MQEIRGFLTIACASRPPLSVAILPIWRYPDSTPARWAISVRFRMGRSFGGRVFRGRSRMGRYLGGNPAGKHSMEATPMAKDPARVNGRGRTVGGGAAGKNGRRKPPPGKSLWGETPPATNPRFKTPRGRMVWEERSAQDPSGKTVGARHRGAKPRPAVNLHCNLTNQLIQGILKMALKFWKCRVFTGPNQLGAP